jgi:hypothetical protein
MRSAIAAMDRPGRSSCGAAGALRADMVLPSGKRASLIIPSDMTDVDFGELVLEIAGNVRAHVAERRNAAPAVKPAPRILVP